MKPTLNWRLEGTENRTLASVNWQRLCDRASALNGNYKCFPTKFIHGGTDHLIRILQFEDPMQTWWVARVPKSEGPTPSSSPRAEVAIMNLIAERTKIRVPHVFDHEETTDNPVGATFILMEFLPGNVAMDLCGGWASHHGIIPFQYRAEFYSSMARIQVNMNYVARPSYGADYCVSVRADFAAF